MSTTSTDAGSFTIDLRGTGVVRSCAALPGLYSVHRRRRDRPLTVTARNTGMATHFAGGGVGAPFSDAGLCGWHSAGGELRLLLPL